MEPNDISPIEIASKKSQAEVNVKEDTHDVFTAKPSAKHDSTNKKRRPKAKGKLKSNTADIIFRGQLYADSSCKTENTTLNTRFKELTLNKPAPKPVTQVINEWPQQPPPEEQSSVTPFCIGVVSHPGVKKSTTSHSESNVRRGKTGHSPSKPITYVDALSKIKLMPATTTEIPSPTTRMKIKDQMKTSHKATHQVSSNSKSLHRQSSKPQTDDDSKPVKGSQDCSDPFPGKAKYRAVCTLLDTDRKNKKSKQKKRNKVAVNMSGPATTTPVGNTDSPSLDSLPPNSDEGTTPLIHSRYIKKLIDETNEDPIKTGDPEIDPGKNNMVDSTDEDTVKSKPPAAAAVIPAPNKMLLPMDIDPPKGDKNCIIVKQTDFHDTNAIDELITKLTDFSVNHCLFFYPTDSLGGKLGKEMKIKQKFQFIVQNRHGMNSNHSFQYMSLLHMAARCGQLHTVKHLIEKYSAHVDVQDCCGRTPLMQALSNPTIVRYLVNMGANVNHQDRNGICPMSLLVSSDTTNNTPSCKETLLFLITAGADLLMVDMFGRSILYYALVGSNDKIINVLLEACPFIPNSRVGQFTFAGKPLLTQWKVADTVNTSVKYYLKLPDSLKLSVEYLNAVTPTPPNYVGSLGFEELKAAFTRLETVLTDKGKLNVTIDYPLPLPVYGNRKEVQTVEELKEIKRNESDGTAGLCFETALQCLLIVERILGQGNYNSIVLLYYITEQLLNKNSGVVTDLTLAPLWGHYIETLAHHVKQAEALSMMKALKHAVSNMSRISFDKPETTKYQNILLEALVTFYRNLNHDYHHHHHNTDDYIYDNNYHLALDFVKYLLNFGNDSQVSMFLNSLPEYPCGHIVMDMIIRLCPTDHIQRCLEEAGAKLLNIPNYHQGITFLHKYDSQSSTYNAVVMAKLISSGAHPDIVDEKGSTAWKKNKKKHRQSSGDFAIQSILKPSSLYCLAANSVISFKFPYRTLDLPQHVIAHVSIHDKDMYPLQRMKQCGFIYHDFKFEEK